MSKYPDMTEIFAQMNARSERLRALPAEEQERLKIQVPKRRLAIITNSHAEFLRYCEEKGVSPQGCIAVRRANDLRGYRNITAVWLEDLRGLDIDEIRMAMQLAERPE